MGTLKIGLGRIYNAQAIKLKDIQDISMKFRLHEVEVEATVSPGLRHIIMGMTFGPPVNKNPDQHSNVTRVKATVFPSSDVFPADMYLEIVAIQSINVDDDTIRLFNEKQDAAMKAVEQIQLAKKAAFTQALDYVAGLMGLRLHCLLVSKLITEQTYVYKPNGYRFGTSFTFTVTDSVALDQNSLWIQNFQNEMPKEMSPDKLKKDSEILSWLLKAWNADDPVLIFSCLFTALESATPGLENARKSAWETKRRSIIKLLNGLPTGRVSDEEIQFMKDLKFPSPSIAEKFGEWAKKEALPGWEADVAAFKKFNRNRNLFLHDGQPDLKFEVNLKEGDLRTLEDIVERYVCLRLFNDARVYSTSKKGRMKNLLPVSD